MIGYTYKGIKYRSRLALSKALNINYDVLKSRLKRGWSLKNAIEILSRTNNKNKIIVDGVPYESIIEACIAYKIPEGRVRVRLSKKWTIEEAFGLTKRRYYNKSTKGYVYIIKNVVNKKVYIGITTTSLSQRLKEHISSSNAKINPNKFQKAIKSIGSSKFYIEKIRSTKYIENLGRLEHYYIEKYNSVVKGYNTLKSGEILCRYGKDVLYEGETYTISELSRKFKISREKVEYRLLNNISLTNNKHAYHIAVKIKNKSYSSLAELGKKFGIGHRTITLRYKKGLRGENLIYPGRMSRTKVQELLREQN